MMTSRTKSQKRKQTIQFLVALSVDLPLDTKLPDEELKRRLRHAIQASQGLVMNPRPKGINHLGKWPIIQPDLNGQVLKRRMWRRNVNELEVDDQTRRERQLALVGLYGGDPLTYFCDALGILGTSWAKGEICFVVKSTNHKFIFAVRVSNTWYKRLYVLTDVFTRS